MEDIYDVPSDTLGGQTEQGLSVFTDFFHHHTHTRRQTSVYTVRDRLPLASQKSSFISSPSSQSGRWAVVSWSTGARWERAAVAAEKTKHSLTEVSHAGEERRDAKKHKTHISRRISTYPLLPLLKQGSFLLQAYETSPLTKLKTD